MSVQGHVSRPESSTWQRESGLDGDAACCMCKGGCLTRLVSSSRAAGPGGEAAVAVSVGPAAIHASWTTSELDCTWLQESLVKVRAKETHHVNEPTQGLRPKQKRSTPASRCVNKDCWACRASCSSQQAMTVAFLAQGDVALSIVQIQQSVALSPLATLSCTLCGMGKA